MNYFVVVINTWQTKSRPYIFVPELSGTNKDEIERIITAVESLPVLYSFNLPAKDYGAGMFPRYYAVYYQRKPDLSDLNIVDIIGIRADKTATRWSYRFGYWHPILNTTVANALRRALKELEEKKEEKVEVTDP